MLKRSFGLVALIVGALMLAMAFVHPWLEHPHRFHIGPFLGGLLLGSLFISYGRRWLLNEVDLDVLSIDPADPLLLEAKVEAQAALASFRAYLAENRYECFVKIPVATISGANEHIWASVHTEKDGHFIVSLANDPVEDLPVTDARFAVPPEVVEDWRVMLSPSHGKGGFSFRAMRAVVRSRGQRLSRQARRQLEVFETPSA
jgi:uncharacterized protein YegJ (DUF2314 family)